MKRSFILVVGIIYLSLMSCVSAYGDHFYDDASEWAKKDIQKYVYSGVGTYSVHRIEYGESITRGNFSTLLVDLYNNVSKDGRINLSDEDYNNFPFVDVYDDRIIDAYYLGFIKGVSETEFCPEGFISREQMAVMLKRLTDKLELELVSSDIKKFSDSDLISTWAEDSVAEITGSGIIKGVSENLFAPKLEITYEQAIVMLMRIYDLTENEPVTFYEDTNLSILSELGIVDESVLEKDGFITNREAFLSIKKLLRTDYDDMINEWYYWYAIDAFKELDYITDEDKKLYMAMCYNFEKRILRDEDVLNISLDEYVTNEQAVTYIARLLHDSESCTDHVDLYLLTELDDIYKHALSKGIISDVSQGEGKENITRSDFYAMLHKAIFTDFSVGGPMGVSHMRHFDNLCVKPTQTTVTKKDSLTVTTVIVPNKITVSDDLSVSWIFPKNVQQQPDDNWMIFAQYYNEQGNALAGTGVFYEENYVLPGKTTVLCFANNPDMKICTLHFSIYKYENKIKYEYVFDIKINCDIKESEEQISAGMYMKLPGTWCASEVTLADGYDFEPGAYYILHGIDDKYRKAEYNDEDYEIFMIDNKSGSYKPKVTSSFGTMYDNVRIRKIDVKKVSDNSFEILITPESHNLFEIKE